MRAALLGGALVDGLGGSESGAQQRLGATELDAGEREARRRGLQLLGRFGKLMPVPLLASWLALSDKAFYERAFTPLITLWYLVFQRLCDNHHLSRAVEDALSGGADRLSPRGKPLSRQLRSEATTSFSDARQRLPLEVCRRTLWHTAAQTAQRSRGR